MGYAERQNWPLLLYQLLLSDALLDQRRREKGEEGARDSVSSDGVRGQAGQGFHRP